MNSQLQSVGRWVVSHPRAILIAWALAVLVGALAVRALPGVLTGGSGALSHSAAQRTEARLQEDFNNPFIDPLFVAVSSERFTVTDVAMRDSIAEITRRLRALPLVRAVATPADLPGAQLQPADGHVSAVLVGLTVTDAADKERAVPVIRRALGQIELAMRRADPTARIAVAGRAAVSYDLNAWNKTEGDRAEARALPVTLGILIVVFGALIAAGTPLLMGLATTTVALGLVLPIAHLMPVSNLIQNVISMVGLALGIDYSLLFLSNCRAHRIGRSPSEAIALSYADSAATILCSGAAVSIGMLGLLFTPLVETRCMGIGGLLVATISVLAALTLLPAALVLLGHRIEALAVPRGVVRMRDAAAFWRRLASRVVRRPLRWAFLSAASVLLVALPGLWARSGFTSAPGFLPAAMESRHGAEALARMGNGNAALPIFVVVRAVDGQPVLAPQHIEALFQYGGQLAADPRVAGVVSAVGLLPGMTGADYRALYADPDLALAAFPHVGELLLSRDRRATLFEITPAARLSLAEVQALARAAGARIPAGPFTVATAGTPAYYNDFDELVGSSLPKVFGFVVLVTLAVLFIAFRSYLIALKAAAMNLLTVAAGYGAVVAIFQFGWLHSLVGLEQSFASIPITVPLMIFCFSFGISMDYEVFILSSIARRHRLGADNRTATIEAVVATAPVVSGAALIMAVVFGAFAGADIVLLKMIGIGLTVAVVIDALVVRSVLVPALVVLAGRWNWYPGPRAAAEDRRAVPTRTGQNC